jgi:hypothetical protein
MTEILDSNGTCITVGARILGWGDEQGREVGTVVELTDPDGDVNEYGRQVAYGPFVIVNYDDGTTERWTATWNATGPWDDDRDDYTCDDVTVALPRVQPVDLASVERLEKYAAENREPEKAPKWAKSYLTEPDGYRMEAGRIVPTDR